MLLVIYWCKTKRKTNPICDGRTPQFPFNFDVFSLPTFFFVDFLKFNSKFVIQSVCYALIKNQMNRDYLRNVSPLYTSLGTNSMQMQIKYCQSRAFFHAFLLKVSISLTAKHTFTFWFICGCRFFCSWRVSMCIDMNITQNEMNFIQKSSVTPLFIVFWLRSFYLTIFEVETKAIVLHKMYIDLSKRRKSRFKRQCQYARVNALDSPSPKIDRVPSKT